MNLSKKELICLILAAPIAIPFYLGSLLMQAMALIFIEGSFAGHKLIEQFGESRDV